MNSNNADPRPSWGTLGGTGLIPSLQNESSGPVCFHRRRTFLRRCVLKRRVVGPDITYLCVWVVGILIWMSVRGLASDDKFVERVNWSQCFTVCPNKGIRKKAAEKVMPEGATVLYSDPR